MSMPFAETKCESTFVYIFNLPHMSVYSQEMIFIALTAISNNVIPLLT